MFWMIVVGNGLVDIIDEVYFCVGVVVICMGMWEGRLGFVLGNSIGVMDFLLLLKEECSKIYLV